MAANLRRGNLPTESTMARFMYFIIKQLDVRGVDWQEVATEMGITNGHAARMRYARYKNQVEGVQPKPREPRAPGTAKDKEKDKKGKGRPVKRQKVEKKEEDGEGEGSVKREGDVDGMGEAVLNGKGKGGKVKSQDREGSGDGEGDLGRKSGGSLGLGAGIKREFNDEDCDGDADEALNDCLNPLDLTLRTDSTSSQPKVPSRKGSAMKIKNEPMEDGASPQSVGKAIRNASDTAEDDAPGETIDPSELSAITLNQQFSSDAAQITPVQPAQPTSAQASPLTEPSALHMSHSQPQHQHQTQAQSPTMPFTMQQLQLSNSHSHAHNPQPTTTPRVFNDDNMASHSSNANLGTTGGYTHLNISSYPTPAYFTQQGQSPATTNSSAPFSLPPSPVDGGAGGAGGGYHQQQPDMSGYNMSGSVMSANMFELGAHNGMMSGHGGVMMNPHQQPHGQQGGFVGMLEDPSFPPRQTGGYSNGGFGGWDGMF